MSLQSERRQTWQQLVTQVRGEFVPLDAQEKEWIEVTCLQISRLQKRLDQIFRQADGLAQCRDCRGGCCALGHNHLSLANLLLWLSQDIELPVLDFTSTCPLLSPNGCIVPAEQRPYSCISFLCDRLEGQLQPKAVQGFYTLVRELRSLYSSFAERYAGGRLTGLLLTARRLQEKPFLQRIDSA